MVTKKIDMDLDAKESDTVEIEIGEDTDKVTMIGNSEDVENKNIEVVIGWYVEGERVGGDTETLVDSPFKLEPVADVLKVQVRNESDQKGTRVKGAIREKKRG